MIFPVHDLAPAHFRNGLDRIETNGQDRSRELLRFGYINGPAQALVVKLVSQPTFSQTQDVGDNVAEIAAFNDHVGHAALLIPGMLAMCSKVGASRFGDCPGTLSTRWHSAHTARATPRPW
jgi:hypothetical protein